MADPGVLLTSPSPHPGWHHGRRWAADGGRPQARRVSWAVWAQRCPAWGPSDQLQAPRVAVGGRRAAAPSEVRQRRDPRALIARGGGRRPAAGSGRHGRRRAADSSGIRAPCTALGGSRGAAGSGAPRGPAAPGSGRSAQLTIQTRRLYILDCCYSYSIQQAFSKTEQGTRQEQARLMMSARINFIKKLHSPMLELCMVDYIFYQV
ncbi:hypothetical protein BS78_09G105700 [Paspalum vaginatum]|nr:hypothetical protein BS78_09G105700 [Paspalum vaginatum]